MADKSIFTLDGVDFNLKDAAARADISTLTAQMATVVPPNLWDGTSEAKPIKVADGDVYSGSSTSVHTDYIDVSAYGALVYMRYTSLSSVSYDLSISWKPSIVHLSGSRFSTARRKVP